MTSEQNGKPPHPIPPASSNLTSAGTGTDHHNSSSPATTTSFTPFLANVQSDQNLFRQPPGTVAIISHTLREFYGEGEEHDGGKIFHRVTSSANPPLLTTVTSAPADPGRDHHHDPQHHTENHGDGGGGGDHADLERGAQNNGDNQLELQPEWKSEAISRGMVWEKTSRFKKFLVQFNVSHFGLALGTSAHAALWRNLTVNFDWVDVPQAVWFILWYVAVGLFSVELLLYFIRAVVFPQGLVRDLRNNRFINFFLSPVIAASALLVSVPPYLESDGNARLGLAMFLMVYQLVFALYIYGDWLFARNFTLDAVDPTYQMAIIGFFLVAGIAAGQNQENIAQFNLYVGILFWIVVFVALFQNIGTSLRNASMTPSPTMFLFVAPPAAAFIAVRNLELLRMPEGTGCSDLATFFIMADSFIYLLLLRLLPIWVFQRFSVAWWAYIFPLSTAASAILVYAMALDIVFWKVAATVASMIAIAVMGLVACLTVYHIFKGNLPKDERAVELYCRSVRSAADAREFARSGYGREPRYTTGVRLSRSLQKFVSRP